MLVDYRSISSSEQHKQQQNVLQLLSRLGISTNNDENKTLDKERNERSSTTRLEDVEADDSVTRLDDSDTRLDDTEADEAEEDADFVVEDPSMVLLSPSPPREFPTHNAPHSISPPPPPYQHPSTSSSLSSSPLEVARRADPPSPPSQHNETFKSPPYYSHSHNNNKRFASTSGKRGLDAVRLRRGETPISLNSIGGSGDANASPLSSSHSSFIASTTPSSDYKRHAQQRSVLFSTSPSPISHHSTNSCLFDDDREDYYRRSAHLPSSIRAESSMLKENATRQSAPSTNSSNDDSIETVDETMIGKSRGFHRQWHDEPSTGGLLFRERSINVDRASQWENELNRRGSSLIHYPPLSVHHVPRQGKTRRPPSKAPLDPLASYDGAAAERMHSVFQRLVTCNRAERQAAVSMGETIPVVKGRIVVSMEYRQIVDVVMKLLLDAAESQKSQSGFQQQPQNQQDMQKGQTLIIVRTKDDLEQWARSLRETTSLSVVNHATLALSERKRPAVASTCASFDVALTTFDATKSPDMVVALDDDGHVLPKQQSQCNSANHWMTSRRCNGSQSQHLSGRGEQQNQCQPQRCKQLCVLHQIMWQRIIFVDELGRKSFLAKPETARASAAVAFQGFSRFIFFPKITQDDDNSKKQSTCAWDALAKSDRNVFASLAAILRLPDGVAVEDFLKVYIDAAHAIAKK